MKNLIFRAAVAAMLAAALCGCEDKYIPLGRDGAGLWVETDSFIGTYTYLDKIYCQQLSDEYGGGVYLNLFSGYENATDYIKGTEEHTALQKKYNDLSYNRVVIYSHSNNVIINNFESIDLVSDADFDDQHPAGTSLADIVRLVSTSPYLYIQNGYKDEFDWKSGDLPEDYIEELMFRREDGGYWPVNGYLANLSAQDMLLLHKPILKFAKTPTLSKTHNMTLICKEADRELRADFEMVFK